MNVQKEKAISQANILRYKKGQTKGHYESYFLRANHPTKKEAFWIRYTIFSAKGGTGTIGELWAIYFTEEGQVSVKKEVKLENCKINNTHFEFHVGDSEIGRSNAKGIIDNFSWELNYESDSEPLFLLPLNYYNLPLPKAKSIVSQPFAKFNGTLTIDGKEINIKDWIGSQNHNWGEKHTDYYAWGQVAGFDNYENSFLELITAQQKIGFYTTPFLTLLVLKHKGKTYQLNTIVQGFKSKGSFEDTSDTYHWKFDCENKEVKITGEIKGTEKDFAKLKYYNPPGGSKKCMNSKIASCHITIEEKTNLGFKDELVSKNRAAFEILSDFS